MYKFIGRHWQKRRERFYLKNRWHLVLDFSLGIIIVMLIATVLVFHYYNPIFFAKPITPLTSQDQLDLNNPPLIIDFSVTKTSISATDPAELKMIYKNDGKSEIKDIKSDLVVVAKNFEIKKIELKEEGNKTDNLKINKNQLNLENLAAGESQVVYLEVYFVTRVKGERNIKWQAQNEYQMQNQSIKEVVSLQDLSVAADLEGTAAIYYNSPQGDILGAGPLPPVVSLPTNYWVFFDVNSTGDFKNLVFTAKLAKNVEVLDRRSLLSGEFKYNADSRQVIWTIADLKNQGDSARVGFEIQFIPTQNQSGNIAVLLSNIKFYATDTLINEVSYGSLPDLTSNLDYDRINKGEGQISEIK